MYSCSGCTNYLQLTREPTSSLTRARGDGLRKVRTPASTTWTSVSGVIGELQPDDQNSVFLYNELDDVKCTTANGGLIGGAILREGSNIGGSPNRENDHDANENMDDIYGTRR
ncbi:uncharacterized protein [Triticum aestivum]|uniref:uncharacterized protein n=1 Tax=Triticum aestivum TaxID=4565 RepID=UPI001D005FBC|nr:uncharacterized protein LOC123142268 [Triticum aestivum]